LGYVGQGKRRRFYDYQERPGMPDLNEILSYVTESPALLAVAAFLLAFLGYAIVKRLLKLALFAVVFIGIYAGLVYLFA
jgi:hypothetical protein